MKIDSLKSHLKVYSILKKRKTTIAHAFASALAPADVYDHEKATQAMEGLGQSDVKNLECVYCTKPAHTWDHLTNLVKAGEFNGYGHQIGNLVPCCTGCNSKKRGASFDRFVDGLTALSEEQKEDLKARLTAHQSLAKAVDSSNRDAAEAALLKQYRKIQDDVLKLMEAADDCAEAIRKLRSAAP